MESSHQVKQEEGKKESRVRYDHLRQIEKQIIERNLVNRIAETQHTEGYEALEFEDKNKGKYFATFPYPYMNGFLHLGK